MEEDCRLGVPQLPDIDNNCDMQTAFFLLANRKHSLQFGESCSTLLDHWQDGNLITDAEIVEPGFHEWYSVHKNGELHIELVKAQAVTQKVARILVEQPEVLQKIGSDILEETITSKFIPLEDVRHIMSKHIPGTDLELPFAIAVFLFNSRLKFFNNGVVLNGEDDVLVIDDMSGWTEASAILIALAGRENAPGQIIAEAASAFQYGPPRGCTFAGTADRAIVEALPVTTAQDDYIQRMGIGGDARYSDRNQIFFKTVTGKWRKAYLQGNLMFVSGMRGRSITSQIPVKALNIMGLLGSEVQEGHKGLEIPTTAMFDVVIRSINAGNSRLSMWFTPKVLKGEIVCCKGPQTMTCYFRSAVQIADVEFGPTIRACILRSGSELGYVVNVGIHSYLLAEPYDSHGFAIGKVSDGAYHCTYGSVPARDRYLVTDASQMFFGAR